MSQNNGVLCSTLSSVSLQDINWKKSVVAGGYSTEVGICASISDYDVMLFSKENISAVAKENGGKDMCIQAKSVTEDALKTAIDESLNKAIADPEKEFSMIVLKNILNNSYCCVPADANDKKCSSPDLDKDYMDSVFKDFFEPCYTTDISENDACLNVRQESSKEIKAVMGNSADPLVVAAFLACPENSGLDPNGDCKKIEQCSAATTESVGGVMVLPDAKDLNGLKLMGLSGDAGGVSKFIGIIIRTLVSVMGAIFFAMFVYAGFLWMTSMGSSEKSGQAMKIMLWSSLGIVAIFSSYVLVQFIFGMIF